MDNHTLYFDGSCWPNPGGTAAYGYILSRNNQRVEAKHAVLGTGPQMSNNVAEYAGLYEGLAAFASLYAGSARLLVRGDSALVVNQMNGKWGAHKDKLYFPHYMMTRDLVAELRRRRFEVAFEWIPREQNTECDDLSKAHLHQLTEISTDKCQTDTLGA